MKTIIFTLFLCPVALMAQLPIINGWTQFSPGTDSRIIYVSSSSGIDVTGQHYSTASPLIGADPFQPVGPINAFQTLAAAKAHLRNGYPDWILFQRGDVFSNQFFGTTILYGKNQNEPMVIGSYGAELQRPVILTGNEGFIDFNGPSASHVALIGLQIEPHTRNGTEDAIGIRIISAPFENILIEDCHISGYMTNLAVHDPQFSSIPTRSNLRVRRCVLADAYVTTNSHANAMFIAQVDSILFEENLLDHNGWSEIIVGADPTGFRHNSYFQVSCDNLIFKENIVARASATGGGFRCGGEIFNNTFLSNPKNIQFGTHESTLNWPDEYVSGSVSYNVILDSRVASFDPGKGITVQRTKDAEVHHNIIAHFTPVGDYNLGLFFNETENVQIKKNIVYNWGNNLSSGPAYSGGIVAGNALLGTNVVDSNQVQLENIKGHCVINHGSFDHVLFSNNQYYNVATMSNWFQPGGSYSNWLVQSGETGSSVTNVAYPDPDRNVSTYLTTLSLNGGVHEFLSLRRALSKWNWDSNFTSNTFNHYIRSGFGMNDITNTTDLPTYQDNHLLIYPNPSTNGLFSIRWPQTSNQQNIVHVYDFSGKRVSSQKTHQATIDIDLSGEPAGLYIIRVENGDHIQTRKIIKH